MAGIVKIAAANPQLYSSLVAELQDGDAQGALDVVAAELGAPAWAVGALTSLLTGDTAGAKAAIETAAGSSTVQGYVALALDYALNASGVPASVLTNADVVSGVLAGNATQVLRGVASEYGLPPWSADAVIALSDGAHPPPRGLAAVFTGTSASSRLSALLVQYNVSGELAALGELWRVPE